MSACHDTHCITCSDEAVPMRVLACDGSLATCVAEDGSESVVMTELVGPVAAGQFLLVHAGAALARMERA